eukprot:gene4879-biopygen1696
MLRPRSATLMHITLRVVAHAVHLYHLSTTANPVGSLSHVTLHPSFGAAGFFAAAFFGVDFLEKGSIRGGGRVATAPPGHDES